MIKYLNLSELEVQEHPSMLKKDSSKFQLSTIKLWYDRVKSGSHLIKPKTGRPQLLTSSQQTDLLNLVKNHPKCRYNIIRKMYLQKYKLNIKRRTLNNYLLKNGYRTYKAIKRPTLQSAHIKKRYSLSKKYQEISNRHKNLIFTDEKKFLLSSENVQLVTRKIGSNPFEHEYMHYGHQVSSNADLNVWAYIGPFGKGELFCAENIRCYYSDGTKKPNTGKDDLKKYRGFDGESYLHLMKYRALPLIKSKVQDNIVIIQDNASIHNYNKNKEEYSVHNLFNDNKIEVEDWPARSPDLNVIENVWAILDKKKNEEIDHRIKFKIPLPKNKAEMFVMLKNLWNSIDNCQIKSLYYSFFRRMDLVNINKGENNFDYKTKLIKKIKMI